MIELTGQKPISKATEDAYRYSLRQFERWCGSEGVRLKYPPHRNYTLAYLQYMAGARKRPSTLNMFVAALCDHCDRKGKQLPHEDKKRALNAVNEYRRAFSEQDGGDDQKGPALLPSHLKHILDVIDASDYDAAQRDGTMIALAWAAALRSNEVVNLRTGDITVKDDCVQVIVRRSKNDQFGAGEVIEARDYGELWGTRGLVERVDQWLAEREEFMAIPFRAKHAKPDYLFCSNARSWVNYTTQRWSRDAGVYFTSHSMRIGFATTMAMAGVRVEKLAMLMRHANPATTARYYRKIDKGDLASEAEQLAVIRKKMKQIEGAGQ